jgi:predicted DNA-binding transcriptional regulator AlpA
MTTLGRLVYTRNDLKELGISYSYPHMKRLIETRKFPMPCSLRGERQMWKAEDIVSWLDARQASRLVPPPPPPTRRPLPKRATR